MPIAILKKKIKVKSQKIADALERGNGSLEEFVQQSAFNMYFIDADGLAVCVKCANDTLSDLIDNPAEPVEIKYLKDNQYAHCAYCNTRIRSKKAEEEI